jgi:phage host-nuclease inhibitor protein Gam
MAATAKRVKLQAVETAPQSREQVNAMIGEIGRHQRERERIQTQMNERLAAVRAQFEELAAPHAGQIQNLSRGIAAWCEAHRDELTAGKTKTVRFATGEVSWRMRPPSVVVRGVEAVIDALRRHKLDRFLRQKTEIDKSAILADSEAVSGVKGLSIAQGEDFVIKPDATMLEEVTS